MFLIPRQLFVFVASSSFCKPGQNACSSPFFSVFFSLLHVPEKRKQNNINNQNYWTIIIKCYKLQYSLYMFKCFKHGNDIILDSKPDDVTETHVSVTPGIYIKAFPFLIQITNISKCLKGPEKYEKKHWYKCSDRG